MEIFLQRFFRHDLLLLSKARRNKNDSDQSYYQAIQGIIDENFCACIPCSRNSTEIAGSFRDKISDANNELALLDLAHKSSTFDLGYSSPPSPSNLFATSPQEGAIQLISAINHCYDVLDLCGGIGIEAKLHLAKDYFRRESLPAHKIRMWGFSNGSAPAIYLADILQPIQSPSANVLFSGKDYALRAIEIMKQEVSEDSSIEKSLSILNKAAHEQYFRPSSFENIKCYAVNAQALLHNLGSQEEWTPPQDHKFILLLEGIGGNYGFSPHESLEVE